MTDGSAPETVAVQRAGGIAGWVAAGLTVVAVVLVVVAPTPPEGARASERLQFVASHQGWHAAPWAVMVLLALVQVPVWAGLSSAAWREHPVAATTIGTFGLMASAFIGWGAWVQLTTVRGLADLMSDFPFDTVAQYRLVGFDAALSSFGHGTIAFGAAAWGVAGVAAWRALKTRDRNLTVLAGSLMGLAGVAALAGAIGFALDSSMLRGGLALAVTLSGVAVATVAAFLLGEARRLTVPEERP